MEHEGKSTGYLTKAMRKDPLAQAKKQLEELREYWAKNGANAAPIPLFPKLSERPGRDWLPEPEWISGWHAFEIIRLQTKPYEWAPAIARICEVIADQWDRNDGRLNYAMATLPPNHELLEGIELGSFRWFYALRYLLDLPGAESIEGWEELVADLYDWIGPYDCLRIRTADFFENALSHHWAVHEFSLPETKQEPIWTFPKAMAWIATREYIALARMPVFTQPVNESEEAVATDGVWLYATNALGWLHSEISYKHCRCGALHQFGWESYKHCTCISIAWEELVHFNGGLSPQTPELVFNIQEGWLSMTWPEGAEEIRFLRRDILERWPAPQTAQLKSGDAGLKNRKLPGPAPDPDWPQAIAKVTQDCIAAGYTRPLKRGGKAAIQTMLLSYMADKDKHFSDDIAAKHAETVIAALPDN